MIKGIDTFAMFSDDYTSEEWDKDFKDMKYRVSLLEPPSTKKPNIDWLENEYGYSRKEVNFGDYVGFLTSVCSEVRTGNRDICFSRSQVWDVLRFFPDLQSRYIKKDRCVEVWIERKRKR